jgi:hypothetical protein
MVISLAAWVLAAICSAVMDLVENENISSSVFANLEQKFWYKRESWKHARKIFGWKFDAWHVFKSKLVVYATISIVSYINIVNPWVDVLIYGAIWNAVFTLFYHKLLRRKTWQ